MLKLSNSAEVRALKILLNVLPSETLVVRLYTNNHTPADSDTAATFTEADGGGYAPITIDPADWTFSTNAEGKAQADHPTLEWTFTGPLTDNASIYGYYVTDSTGNELRWAERDPEADVTGPFQPQNNGDRFRVTPRITHASET